MPKPSRPNTLLASGTALLLSACVVASAVQAETADSCTFTLPQALSNTLLTDPALPDSHQVMGYDNVVFVDNSPGKDYVWNYKQSVLANLSDCRVTTKHSIAKDGSHHFELNMQGTAKDKAAMEALGQKFFTQNNLFIYHPQKPQWLGEYFLVGATGLVDQQVKDRDAALKIKDNPVLAGYIDWQVR